MSYRPISVPGFGCTYAHEFEERGVGAYFRLRILGSADSVQIFAKNATLIFPLEAGRAVAAAGRRRLAVDFRHLAILPAGSTWELRSEMSLLKVACIEPTDRTIRSAAEEFALDERKLGRLRDSATVLPRTVWINEVCHRYIFERSIAKRPDSRSAGFLETELVKESCYKLIEPDRRYFFAEMPLTVQRALQYIEEHVFEPIALEDLQAAAACSKATLIRTFSAAVGIPPMRYVWGRRLQEARLLLATGRYTVADVSGIVGYKDVSSFSHAYLRHFDAPPSEHRG